MTCTRRYLFLSLISLIICFTSAEQNLNANPHSQTLQNVLNAYDDLCRVIDEFNLDVLQFEHLRNVSMLKYDWGNCCNCMEKAKKKIEEMNQTIHNLEHFWSDFDTKVYLLESGIIRTVKEIRSLKLMAKIAEMKLGLLASNIDRVLVFCNHKSERNGFLPAFIVQDMIFYVSAGMVFSFVLGSLILLAYAISALCLAFSLSRLYEHFLWVNCALFHNWDEVNSSLPIDVLGGLVFSGS